MRRPSRRTITLGVVRHGEQSWAYTLVRSTRRIRTIALHVDGGELRVLAPMRTSQAEIDALLARRSDWIAARLQAVSESPPVLLASGTAELPYRGVSLRVSVTSTSDRRATVELTEGELRLSLPLNTPSGQAEPTARTAIEAWYRARALELVREAVERWSATSGLVPKAVFVRDQKRRWGSCAPDGTLRFNWRLAMFAPAVLEYVVVHELIHLRHRNHAPAFWAAVEELLPAYREQRAALKQAVPNL